MKCFILITGTEFTLGLKPEKNSLYIARRAFSKGLDIVGIGITNDDIYQISFFLKIGLDKADIVFISGGLGGTSDDLTREAVEEALGVPLIYDEDWLKKLKEYLKKTGRDLNDSIKKMAKIPYGSKKIENPKGRALGFIKILDDVKKAVVALPGVPEEMKPMLEEAFRLLGLKEEKKRVHLFRTFGKNEIEIDELLKDIDGKVINASPKGVDIFIIDKEPFFLENKVKVAKERLGNIIYAEEEIEMEEVVGSILTNKNLTISTAESSTGGLIASRIVNVPGSSKYFMGSIVSYSNEAKIYLLNVKKENIEKYGAVSPQVAKEMVKGALEKFKTDIALSDTGIAGPTGYTEEKPLGLHYIGFGHKNYIETHKVIYQNDRNSVRLYVSQYALNLIRLKFLNT
ncbi:MAG: nicotinamide-nucleotide amidohydrolase family protein [Aquificae bacterium]|nr:nicotinamide-nucleotide amidohydrolase family protein [Aquificota bacterium]